MGATPPADRPAPDGAGSDCGAPGTGKAIPCSAARTTATPDSRPCWAALRLARVLPSGPVDWRALRRLASVCSSVTVLAFPFLVTVICFSMAPAAAPHVPMSAASYREFITPSSEILCYFQKGGGRRAGGFQGGCSGIYAGALSGRTGSPRDSEFKRFPHPGSELFFLSTRRARCCEIRGQG